MDKQSVNIDYNVKIIEAISIDHNPTIVICNVSQSIKPGSYFIKNINDVMITQKIRIEAGPISYTGDHRIELVVMNLVSGSFKLLKDFTIAKLVPM